MIFLINLPQFQKHIGLGEFDLDVGDETIMEIDVRDMKAVTQHYQPRKNYLKIFPQEHASKGLLAEIIKKGLHHKAIF